MVFLEDVAGHSFRHTEKYIPLFQALRKHEMMHSVESEYTELIKIIYLSGHFLASENPAEEVSDMGKLIVLSFG